jgi:amino acid transporter
MLGAPKATPTEENTADHGRYNQELKRTLGPAQIFAISFAFISVAVGVFGTYDDVLRNAGPVGIWLWVIPSVGQTLVALVIAQFAARISLAGSCYSWASRLATPKIGWGFGWISFCYLAVGVVAVDNGLASMALMPVLGLEPNEDVARIITIAVLLIQAVLAITSTRIVGFLNGCAVGVEISIIAVLVVALTIAVMFTGLGSTANLTTRGITANASNYWGVGGGLSIAMIMGLGTLVGFDAAANLSEEAKEPYRNVPRAIVGSVIAAAVLGLLFLIALTVAIPDVPRLSNDPSPVATILREQLGHVVEVALMTAITFAFFACGMVTMATGARLIYAMSRDSRFPAHQLMRRVSPRTQTPVPATLLLLAGGIVLMLVLPGDALYQLITASTILPILLYMATVALYLGVRGKLGRQEGAFDLGRFESPIAIIALIWLVFALFVLVTPNAALVPAMIVLGLMVVGGLFFLSILVFNREALDSLPEAQPVVKH